MLKAHRYLVLPQGCGIYSAGPGLKLPDLNEYKIPQSLRNILRDFLNKQRITLFRKGT